MSATGGNRKLALVLAAVGLAALIGATWALFPVARHPSLTEMPNLSGLDPPPLFPTRAMPAAKTLLAA